MTTINSKPTLDHNFTVVSKTADERRFFGTRNGISVELIPAETYPETELRIVAPHGEFKNRLFYSHLGFAKLLTEYDFDSVLDIGSGGGSHAEALRFLGKRLQTVEIIDELKSEISGDFITTNFSTRFDLVWCSHVLEHQRNVGEFLDHTFEILEDNGILAVTVPSALSPMIMGHPNIFTPMHMVYHLILAGFDCSAARIKSYDWQFTIIIRKHYNGVRKSNIASTNFPMDAPNYLADLLEYFPVRVPENGHIWGEVDSLNW